MDGWHGAHSYNPAGPDAGGMKEVTAARVQTPSWSSAACVCASLCLPMLLFFFNGS